MKNHILKLLSDDNSIIAEIQKNRPLLVTGYSPFKLYFKSSLKGKILLDIYFYDEQRNKKRIAYNVQLETLSIFPLYSKLYQEKIALLGKNIILDININDFKVIQIKKLNQNIKEQILKHIYFSDYDYMSAFKIGEKTILIPSHIIGNFFYYPNSYLKRAFFSQNISLLVKDGLSNCKNHAICFSGTHVKFTETNAILSYLYYCDKLAQKYFYNSFSYMSKYNTKINNKNFRNLEKDFVWINPKFVFPLSTNFKNPVKTILRGIDINNNIFLALEILDIDFKNLLGKNEIIAFYESKKRSEEINIKKFPLGKMNLKSLSHTKPYSSFYEISQVELIKNNTYSNIDEILVKKGMPISLGEYMYSFKKEDNFNKSKGVTLDETRNGKSEYAKGYISFLNFNFKKAMELLAKKLNIQNEISFVNKPEYLGFLFWWNRKNYFVLELKKYNAYTLLFSSSTPLDYNSLSKIILDIKKGYVQKNYKKVKKELANKKIIFHTPQKHMNEDIEKWVDRLIAKIKR